MEPKDASSSLAAISPPQLSEAKQRAPVNLLANGLWLVLNAGVNLWYVPFLINHLGVSVYGLIPLATSLTRYITIITDGFNGAVSRFLTIDLAQSETGPANVTFNTAVLGSGLLTLTLLPVVTFLAIWAPNFLDVPAGHTRDAQVIIFCVMFGFLITTFAGSFAVSSFAYHRFDLRFLINAVRICSEVGIPFLLFAIFAPRLWQVGVGTVAATLFFLGGHVLLWRRLTPQLHVSFHFFDWRRLRELLGFSGWVLINQVGSLLFLNIDLLVANLLFGAMVGGRYGAVIVFPTLLRSLAATINGVLIPVIMGLYAQERIGELLALSRWAVKMMGLLMALPIGLLCGLGRPLLSLWLGPEFADLSWLVMLLVGHLAINTAVIPLFSLQVATNRVRVPALMTLGSGVVNAVLAYSLARWSGLGYLGIAAAGAMVLTAKNGFFTTWYGAHIIDVPARTFVQSVLVGGVSSVLVTAVAYATNALWPVTAWWELAGAAALIALAYLPAAYLFGLNRRERQFLLSEFRNRISL